MHSTKYTQTDANARTIPTPWTNVGSWTESQDDRRQTYNSWGANQLPSAQQQSWSNALQKVARPVPVSPLVARAANHSLLSARLVLAHQKQLPGRSIRLSPICCCHTKHSDVILTLESLTVTQTSMCINPSPGRTSCWLPSNPHHPFISVYTILVEATARRCYRRLSLGSGSVGKVP